MIIYAKDKNIPTYALSGLLTQGEKYSDTIIFSAERFYDGKDLYGCSFIIRGVGGSSLEAVQPLVCSLAAEDRLELEWRVSDFFTAVAGELELEITASRITDGETELVLKYNMAPIKINPSPAGENAVVPDTAEQIKAEIAKQTDEGLEQIQALIESFDLAAVEERLDKMEADTAIYLARPEVVALTQEQYDRITPKENSLYVIVKEET